MAPAIEVNGFVHSSDYISHYVSGSWDDIGDSMTATAVAGGMFSVQRKGVTSMSPFAVFDKSTVTGIDQIVKNGVFEIYPNPVSENLYIKSKNMSKGILYVDIFNVLGQKVGAYTTTNTETAIPVEGLARGQYFIKLYNDNTVVVEKFIKM